MRDIEKVIRAEVPVSEHSSHKFDRIATSGKGRSRRGSGGSRFGNSGGRSARPFNSDGANREGGGREGSSREGGNRDGAREGQNASGGQARAPHGLHYSNEGYSRPSSLQRGRKFYSARNDNNNSS
jgi:ATP-dependent RNA helicase SUPV3L1/SUV3